MRITSTARIRKAEEKILAEGPASFAHFKNQSPTADISFTVHGDDANYRVSMSASELLVLLEEAANGATASTEGRALAAGSLASLAALLGA